MKIFLRELQGTRFKQLFPFFFIYKTKHMKKHKRLPALPKRSIFKMLLLLKFMVVFILLATTQLAARPFAQDRITLNLQSAGLKTALKEIEKQTIFRFLYNDEVVSSDYKVSINAINKPVTEVLDNIFTSTSLRKSPLTIISLPPDGGVSARVSEGAQVLAARRAHRQRLWGSESDLLVFADGGLRGLIQSSSAGKIQLRRL